MTDRQGVEFRKYLIELGDQTGSRHQRGGRREADDVGKKDRGALEAVGDDGLAGIEADDHRVWQYVAQQPLGSLLLRMQPRQIFALARPPALAFEACIDAGAQEHDVERLLQIILSTRLDAANDCVGLAQARYHDHRKLAPARIGFEPFEHLDPVHVGHQQIEQYKVEGFLLDDRQRARSRIGRRHLVALMDKPPAEKIAIGLVVVDDENAPNLLRLGERLFGPQRAGKARDRRILEGGAGLAGAGGERSVGQIDDVIETIEESP